MKADSCQYDRVVALNSVAGLVSVLINVYSQHHGDFSITAKVAIITTGSCTVLSAILFLLYNYWVLGEVRKEHERQLGINSGK